MIYLLIFGAATFGWGVGRNNALAQVFGMVLMVTGYRQYLKRERNSMHFKDGVPK